MLKTMVEAWPFLLAFLTLLKPCLGGGTYDNGYWTPSPTYYPEPSTNYPPTTYYPEPSTYYPPTTYYTSYWTPTSYYTTCYTQGEVIVTITSIIPCPVTSTVIYYTYQCNQCNQCNDCCDGHNNCCMYDHCYGYGTPGYSVGTTTVSLFTTVPPSPVQTITSNGLVVVVMDTGSYVQSLGATGQVQVVSGAALPVKVSTPAMWISMAGILAVAALMVAL